MTREIRSKSLRSARYSNIKPASGSQSNDLVISARYQRKTTVPVANWEIWSFQPVIRGKRRLERSNRRIRGTPEVSLYPYKAHLIMQSFRRAFILISSILRFPLMVKVSSSIMKGVERILTDKQIPQGKSRGWWEPRTCIVQFLQNRHF